MTCINLRQRFGQRFRIQFDPVYDPKRRHRDKLDPWMMTIPSRYGTVYPHGGDTLAVEVEGHPLIKGQLDRLPCCRLYQDGDEFGCFLFDVGDFDTVAEIVKPWRKPQVSEETRQKLRERMRAYHAQKPDAPPAPAPQTSAETSTR